MEHNTSSLNGANNNPDIELNTNELVETDNVDTKLDADELSGANSNAGMEYNVGDISGAIHKSDAKFDMGK